MPSSTFSFSVAFDSEPLGQRIDGWRFAGPLGWLAVLAVSCAVGSAFVLNAGRLRLQQFLGGRRLDGWSLLLLGGHLLAVSSLWWLSARVFASAGPPRGSPVAWLLGWALLASASVVLALVAAVPLGSVRGSAATAWPALAGGAVIGGGAWLAGQSSALLWWPLGPSTLRAADMALGALLGDAVSDPSSAVIGSTTFQVQVAPACSGFEGIGLMTVFVAAYLVLARRELRFPQALLLLPVGLVAAWGANVVRLVSLVLVGTWISEELALGGFHARAGWLLFCAVALSLVVLAQRARLFAREAPGSSRISHPSAAYLLPFLTLVASALVTGLVTTDLDLLYGVRVLVTIPVLVAFRRFYRGIGWSWSWEAVGAGLVAALAFLALASRPDSNALEAWQQEWLALPRHVQVLWVLLRTVGSVLLVPVAEELAFRGYLLRRLVSRDFLSVSPGHFSPWALVVSSVLFGAMHQDWIAGTAAGLLFGIVQVRGKSVAPAILAHVVSNAAIAVFVALGAWWLWT